MCSHGVADIGQRVDAESVLPCLNPCDVGTLYSAPLGKVLLGHSPSLAHGCNLLPDAHSVFIFLVFGHSKAQWVLVLFFAIQQKSKSLPNALAMLASIFNPTLYLPASIRLTCSRLMPALSASSCCVMPCSARIMAMRLPM